MVEDRIRNGRRIAQLLASELTGRSTGPLGDASVVDADADAEPSPAGTRVYDVVVDGEPLATVSITDRTVRVAIEGGDAVDCHSVAGRGDLSIESGGDGPVVVVESGAAVKGVVDVLSDAME